MVTMAVSEVLKDLIYLAALAVLCYGVPFLKKVGKSLLVKAPAAEREFLSRAANDAVVFTANQLKSSSGADKFKAAVDRVTQVLGDHGLKISATDVEQAVESAYQNSKYWITEPQSISPAVPSSTSAVADDKSGEDTASADATPVQAPVEAEAAPVAPTAPATDSTREVSQ